MSDDGDPEFLTLEDVLEMHAAQLARWGGLEGARDLGAVDSAVAQARNAYAYRGENLYEIAATYAFHIAEAQGFIDGNKRTAVDAAMTFLALNGLRISDPDSALYGAMVAIAKREMDKTGLAALLEALDDGAVGPPDN